MMYYRHGGFPGAMGFFMLAILALLITSVVLLVKVLKNNTISRLPIEKSAGSVNSNAAVILDERLAKGEIDEEEYTRKKQMLISKN